MDIKTLSHTQLVTWLKDHGIRSFRADQIFKWIYHRQADTFHEMTDLNKALRQRLATHFTIDRLETVRTEDSADGSRKFLFRLADGELIESVLIPERGHDTLCISSQVGCAMGCRFCLTGRAGLIRNLTAAEIISQVRDVKRTMSDPDRLTNIVFMGMGEPFANYENLMGALRVLTDNDRGLRFASRRVTVSTAGLVPAIERFGTESPVNLAVSLNAADGKTRDLLMPVNRRYPMDRLLEACARYPLKPHRRITFEYILIKGINDSPADAERLAKLLRPVRSKINLIPFNPHEGSRFERPAPETIDAFLQVLLDRHYTAIVRKSKGQDISAACGQLRGKAGIR